MARRRSRPTEFDGSASLARDVAAGRSRLRPPTVKSLPQPLPIHRRIEHRAALHPPPFYSIAYSRRRAGGMLRRRGVQSASLFRSFRNTDLLVEPSYGGELVLLYNGRLSLRSATMTALWSPTARPLIRVAGRSRSCLSKHRERSSL